MGLQGVPLGFDRPLWGEVHAGDGTPVGWAPIEMAEDGQAVLITPIHPRLSLEGGQVRIRVSDGEVTCEGVPFTIARLPEAPGTMVGLVDALQGIVDAQARRLWTTAEALHTAAADTLPQGLLPLYFAQRVLDHPDNLNSLRAVAEGRAPMVDSAAVDVRLLDALLARSGAVRGLEQGMQEASGRSAYGGRRGVRRVSATLQPRLASLPMGYGGREALPSPTRYARLPIQTSSGQLSAAERMSCLRGEVTTAAVLEHCMRVANDAAFELRGASGKVLKDVGQLAGVVGIVHAPTGAVAGLATWLVQTAHEAVASLVPSEFTRIQVEIVPEEFPEDFGCDITSPVRGQWRATVFASSKGWSADKLVLKLLLQSLSLQGALFGPTDGLIMSTMSYIRNQFVQEAVNQSTGVQGEGVIYHFPADTVGPIDISDEEWSDRRIVFGDAIRWQGHGNFVPEAVDLSLIEVRSKDGKFGTQIVSDHHEIRVRRIEVAVDPDLVRVEPGDRVAVEARVSGACDPSISADVTAGSPPVTIGQGDGVHFVEFTSPADESAYDVLLTVRSDSESGLRATSNEPRAAVVTVEPRNERLRIAPGGACIAPGADTLFTVERVDGTEPPPVRWSASAGDISSGGMFRAPDETGEVQIVVTAASDPGLVDTVTVDVAGCTCWAYGQLGPPVQGHLDGFAGFRVGDVPLGVPGTPTRTLVLGMTNVNQLPFRGEVAGAIGETTIATLYVPFPSGSSQGSHPIREGTITLGPVGQQTLLGIGEDHDGRYGNGTVSISRHTDDMIEGSVQGTFEVRCGAGVCAQGEDQQTVTFTARFRALTGSVRERESAYFQCLQQAP